MSDPEGAGRSSAPSYVLGHTDHELERLQRQARLKDPITSGFFVDAGIGPGMDACAIGAGPVGRTLKLGYCPPRRG